jgi:hypothetical protein
MTAHNEDLLKGFPKDICTAQKLFDVEPTTTTYAACSTCSATYCIKEGKTLPINCNWKQYLNAKRVPVLREPWAQNGINLGAKKKWKKKNLVQILKVGHSLVAFMRPIRSYSHFEKLGTHLG